MSAARTVVAGPHARTPATPPRSFSQPRPEHALRGLVIAATLALSLTSFDAARAQSAVAVEAGFVTAFEEAGFLAGVRMTSVKPQSSVGVDFSLHTFPDALVEGFLLLMPNLDLTTPVPIGTRSWLLPRLGVSALVGLGEGAGAVPGLNVGVGLLGRVGERMGLRLDATHTRYFSDGSWLALTTLTFGVAWIK